LQLAGRPSAAEMEERRRAGGLSQHSVLVGFLGRIIPLKGPDCLLAAAQTLIPRHPHLHFVLLGDGCLRTALEQQAVSLGARFQLLGDRPSSEWFPLIDILVLPSESEGLPFAVLEAMAWGKPVVASAVGGVPEAVVDGETGLLIPPGDVRALETALNTLICHPEMRRQMGLAGRARAERLFDSRQMARSFENLYVRLSERRRDSGKGFTPS
jgi:glycosyltransferase involved in cell wall biosynthesis